MRKIDRHQIAVELLTMKLKSSWFLTFYLVFTIFVFLVCFNSLHMHQFNVTGCTWHLYTMCRYVCTSLSFEMLTRNNFEERKIIATLKKHPNVIAEQMMSEVEQLLMMRGTRLSENRFQSTRDGTRDEKWVNIQPNLPVICYSTVHRSFISCKSHRPSENKSINNRNGWQL